MELEKNTLYREIIMEHYKNPLNRDLVSGLTKYSVKNPVCGDSITVQLDIKNGIIEHIYQNSIGCSISTSATSIFSELLKGKTIVEAKTIIEAYKNMVAGQPYKKDIDLGEAEVFSGIADYPARFKCATVALEAILKAVADYENK